MNPLHLLLVEDDAVSRGFLHHALELLPATVVDTAADAAQALARVREQAYSLWLIDANLPDSSGERLLGELRALHPDIAALCLTAEVDGARLDALKAAGFVEVLQKPMTTVALHAAVRRALKQVAAQGEAVAQVLDDALALQALGGNIAALHALRGLFVAELPAQSEAVLHAIAAGDADAMRAELHRLKASCGFVGSSRLLDAVRELADAPFDPAMARQFSECVAEVLVAIQPSS